MLLTYWKRKSYPTNLLFLTGFTLLEAYTISVIVSFYQTQIVLNAVILTGGIFVFLTLFACQTRYDFTSWMPYLFGALWGLLLFGFMAAFLPYSSTAELVYGGLAALIFSAYILVDTQLVMRHHHVEEEIAASISLYLDIINLLQLHHIIDADYPILLTSPYDLVAHDRDNHVFRDEHDPASSAAADENLRRRLLAHDISALERHHSPALLAVAYDRSGEGLDCTSNRNLHIGKGSTGVQLTGNE